VTERFCEILDDAHAERVRALALAIFSLEYNISADVKWNRLTFSMGKGWDHWLCGIAVTKKAIALHFHFGGLLENRYSVFITSESRFLRRIEFVHGRKIDADMVQDYVRQAMARLEYFRDNWKELNRE
jgi:hypothetical protein